MKDPQRVTLVRQLWRQRPPEKRTDNDVLAFYGELQENRPELLKRGHGDPYQQLQADLSDLVREKQ